MSRATLFFLSAALFLCLAFGYVAGIFFRFFWIIWWYDIVLHAFGGLAIGLLAGSLYVVKRDTLANIAFKAVLPVALAAITWEFVDSTDVQIVGDYVLDTAVDLAMGIAGGLVAVLIVGLSARAK